MQPQFNNNSEPLISNEVLLISHGAATTALALLYTVPTVSQESGEPFSYACRVTATRAHLEGLLKEVEGLLRERGYFTDLKTDDEHGSDSGNLPHSQE